MDAYLELAKAQAVQDMVAALLQGVSEALAAHGDDPESAVIISAGFAMALKKIGEKIDPKVPKIVFELLAS